MALAEQRAKNAKMAKFLVERGFPHGKRMTKPNPNSGGAINFSDLSVVGSAAYRRLMASRYTSR